MPRYRWAQLGDINAFFGLMLDNMANLVILSGILIFVFQFPEDIVYTRMFPGTALGVMFGDLVYTWLAFRLAAKTGREVTAMPLGLDAPSTIGMAFAVLGPAFINAKAQGLDPQAAGIAAWQIGMATMVLIGVFKLILAFVGKSVSDHLPDAGLLGTLGGIGIALLGVLQFGELLHDPIVGFASLGLILYSLVAKIKLPFGVPEVGASALVGTILFYGLSAAGLAHGHVDLSNVTFHLGFPWPTLGFVTGMPVAFSTYLPLAIPFAILTVVGGINVTASARREGDDYDTREILLTEALATLIAGVCGGVSQTTPYIGQPAYKAMGGRAGYTLATGLFIGLGGIFGYIPLLAQVLPKAAIIPILLFVAVDIVEQSYHATPKKHAMAVTFAMFPNIAQLVMILVGQANFKLSGAAANPAQVIADTKLPPDFVGTIGVFVMLAHGFILTGMLWGSAIAFLMDRRAGAAASTWLACAGLTLFGVIHSADPDGGVYLPWSAPSSLPLEWAVGYALMAATFYGLSFTQGYRDAVAADA